MKTAILSLAALLLALQAALHAVEVSDLRCEYLKDPLGIDVEKPRLSWVIEVGRQRTEDRGQKQTAYQVLVASTPELLTKDKGDLWDSGKVDSDQSIQVEYAGPSTSLLRQSSAIGKCEYGIRTARRRIGARRRHGRWDCSNQRIGKRNGYAGRAVTLTSHLGYALHSTCQRHPPGRWCA